MKIETKLKIGDKVTLDSEFAHFLYDGGQIYKDQYKQIHQNNVKGEITYLKESYDHYGDGIYASVSWESGFISEWIHISWLDRARLNAYGPDTIINPTTKIYLDFKIPEFNGEILNFV